MGLERQGNEMAVRSLHERARRLPGDAGIAIGPILFIIAVLGILAAAIAAGSGSFTTSTTGESNRTKAAALIEIGQNLKIGFDRIVGNGTDFPDVVIDPTATENEDELFSPTGGGITSPSRTMADDPAVDEWHYPLMAIPGIGTASGGVRVAIIKVSAGVCTELNAKAGALTATPAGFSIADLTADPSPLVDATSVWPSDLDGKPTGCFEVTGGGQAVGFYFYQVIGIMG